MINQMSIGSTNIKSSSERIANQRPRRRDCNVLKFHNFVPNKELSCVSRIRGSNENVLTGHCLKEENGSKQINVCNWQKKQQQSTTIINESGRNDLNQQISQLPTKQIPITANDITLAPISDDDLTSQSILGSLLARSEINRIDNANQPNDLIDGYTVINVGENVGNNSDSMTINSNYGLLVPLTRPTIKTTIKANRRKPSTVRRFLRSPESPSNDDGNDESKRKKNQDEPLDLSTARKRPLLRKKGETTKNEQLNQLINYLPVLIPGTSQRLPQAMITSFLPYLLPENQQSTIKSANPSSTATPTTITTTGIDPMILFKQNKLLIPQLSNDKQSNRIPILQSANSIPTNSSQFPSPSSPSSSLTSMVGPLNQYLHHSSRGSTSTIPGIGHFKVHSHNHQKVSSSGHHHNHNQHANRNNQNGPVNERNTIKAKLENEFRTNGFLVKTKEVSDGEATFCKFRQLRKYTRYYLKSWHQHLPDEINKLWKGFLPPKTSKPSSSSSTPTATINSTQDQMIDQPTESKRLILNGQPMDITPSSFQHFTS